MDSGFEEQPLNGQSNQEFKPNDNISAKVDDSVSFKPFFGDTVVFGYRQVGFDYRALDKLVHIANELSKNKLEIVLRTDMLYYQHFKDMNSYTNVFHLEKWRHNFLHPFYRVY